MASREICRGSWGAVVLAVRANGSCPAADFIKELSVSDATKVQVLFLRCAESGPLKNPEKFKKIADDLHELKSFQIRLFCFIRSRRIVFTHGALKKRDKLDSNDIDRAERIRQEFDAQSTIAVITGKKK